MATNKTNKGLAWAAIIIAVIILIIIVTAVSNPNNTNSQDKDKVVKIGVIAPLTGEVADIGLSAVEGIELAAEEFNAKGGIQIELLIEDGKCAGPDSADAANKLININGVNAIVGGLCSGETLAAAPIAESSKVILFSGCSSAPTITNAGDYIFRSYPSDAYQGVYAARYVYNDLGKTKVGIIYTNSDWGFGVQESFTQEFEKLGGEIVALETVEQEATDLRTTILKVKSKNPEVLYTPMYPQGQGLLAKQAKEAGLNAQILGADGAKGQATIDAGGDAAEGIQFTAVKEFENPIYKQKLETAGIEDMLCTPTAYDAATILFKGIDSVGENPDKIKNYLYSVKNFQGASGAITIDQNGDRTGSDYSVFEIQNKEFVAIR